MNRQIMKTSNKRKSLFEELQGTTDEIISQIRKLIKKGSVRRVIIQNKRGKVLFQSQLNAGVAGGAVLAVLSPVIAAVSFFAIALSDAKVVVEKYPEDMNDEDKYEVEAEVIEIENDAPDSEDKMEKTVGK